MKRQERRKKCRLERHLSSRCKATGQVEEQSRIAELVRLSISRHDTKKGRLTWGSVKSATAPQLYANSRSAS